MISRNGMGQVIRVHSYTGQMRKHGSDRPAFTDPVRIELDAVAHSGVKTPRRGAGYIRIRKGRTFLGVDLEDC